MGEEDNGNGNGVNGDDDGVDDGTDDGTDDENGGTDEPVDIHILLPEAAMYNLPHFYGRDHNVWSDRGINISYEVTGFGQYVRGFSGDLNVGVGQNSGLSLAENIYEDVPISIFAPHMNEINHVFVRDDSDIESVPDLEGQVLGVAGLGSGTTRTFMGMWDEMYDFDLENDPAEVVDSSSASLYSFLEDGEIDAALMFTGYTVSALADDNMRSIFYPVDEWQDRTGHPGQVTLYAVFDEFLESNPEAVLNFWDGWVEAVEIFRDEFDTAIQNYGAISGVDLDEEEEIAVIQELVDNEEIFPLEWSESLIESNIEMLEVVEDVGGITGFTGRDAFITHDEIE
ncbi:ABC transporter substrate-binding protein [Natrarchaeobius chitinivorans]|nr:ABC transporter substrate-binding protein [Natrarchaeobius chitinivorans]